MHALSDHFRGRFLHLARRAVPMLRIPEMDWDKRWIVYAKPVARPCAVLDYLARYVHRTALSNKAITACDDRAVSFTYRDSRDGVRKAMTLPADEFLRRFLQHVPLRGLHRVRAFGLLHPRERNTLRRLQLMLAPRTPATADVCDEPRTENPKTLRCPHCKEPKSPLCAESVASPPTSVPPSSPPLPIANRSLAALRASTEEFPSNESPALAHSTLRV